ncbi:MAG: alpha/beta hydrolase [Clostridiales bacterium]|nr:alpha/beta hydrolase [Clostridiales bacterium]
MRTIEPKDSFKVKEDTFISSDGVTEVVYYVYTPTAMPRAVLQISHGMNEYIGRYGEFVEFLCENGVVVCGNDHLGHGKTAKTEEDRGRFGEAGAIAHLTADLKLLHDIMRRRYRGLPYIMFGHSMGSFIARDYISTYKDDCDACILSGTSAAQKGLGAGIFLTKFLAGTRGPDYRSKFVHKMSDGGYNKHFKGETGFEWLTKDTEITAWRKNDEYSCFLFTVQSYNDLFNLLKDINEDGWFEEVPKSLPIMLISGLDDPVGDMGRGVTEVYDRLLDADASEVRIKLIPGDRHEVLNETDRDEVRLIILEFIDDIIDGIHESRMQQTLLYTTPLPEILQDVEPEGGSIIIGKSDRYKDENKEENKDNSGEDN